MAQNDRSIVSWLVTYHLLTINLNIILSSVPIAAALDTNNCLRYDSR